MSSGLHGERGRDLERALAPVGELTRRDARELAEVHALEERQGALVQDFERLLALPEVEARAQAALQRDAHVFQHGEVGKDRRDLERTDDAAARDVGGLVAGDVLAVEEDGAGGRRQELGEQVEDGVFPAPLGPMRAWIAPRRTLRFTPSTATNPLNSLVRPRVSRMVSPVEGVPMLQTGGGWGTSPVCAADATVASGRAASRRTPKSVEKFVI
jgi:hypothetical protein